MKLCPLLFILVCFLNSSLLFANSWEEERSFDALIKSFHSVQAKFLALKAKQHYLQKLALPQIKKEALKLQQQWVQFQSEVQKQQKKIAALQKTVTQQSIQKKLQEISQQKEQQVSILKKASFTVTEKEAFLAALSKALKTFEEQQKQQYKNLMKLRSAFLFDPFLQGSLSASIPFKPTLHGFHFRNSFKGYPIPSLPFLETILKKYSRGRFGYGLCGGMSTAAYDYYLAQKQIPAVSNVPQKGTPLYNYIFKRQAHTFGPKAEYIFKFIEWMALSDTILQERSYTQLKALCHSIDNGQAAVLGLVYVKASQTLVLWKNHQILAYGYQKIPEQNKILIQIYDPNYPKNNQIEIQIEKVMLPNNVIGIKCQQLKKGVFRKVIHGFFIMPYNQEPPINF